MSITPGGGNLYADLKVGFKCFSLPALFTEEFFLPKSANLTLVYNGMGFCISFAFQIFISSCPNLCKSFTWAEILRILAKTFLS